VKVGDNVIISTKAGMQTMLVVREMTFKEYCEINDDLMLEYNVDNAWEHWQKQGPLFEVLHGDGTLGVTWPN
jgi:dTDP-4-dehydrorhamnose 3,5-epimerase-like enzyme